MPYKLRFFIPLFVLITGVLGVVYVVAHQNLRQGANAEQIRISEDIAAALDQGADPKKLLPTFKVDIEKSLTPFVIIFNDQDKVVSSTATFRGQTPVLPTGVLEHVRENGQSRITWQPDEGIRSAIVVTRANNGFVLAGRSLRETEKQVDMLTLEIFGAWVIINIATLIAVLLFTPLPRQK